MLKTSGFQNLVLISTLFVVFGTQPTSARGWHARDGRGGDAGTAENRHGSSAYGKAKVEELDRLLTKLKDICRGC